MKRIAALLTVAMALGVVACAAENVLSNADFQKLDDNGLPVGKKYQRFDDTAQFRANCVGGLLGRARAGVQFSYFDLHAQFAKSGLNALRSFHRCARNRGLTAFYFANACLCSIDPG